MTRFGVGIRDRPAVRAAHSNGRATLLPEQGERGYVGGAVADVEELAERVLGAARLIVREQFDPTGCIRTRSCGVPAWDPDSKLQQPDR